MRTRIYKRVPVEGDIVKVHFNLHHGDVFSIRDTQAPFKNKVILHDEGPIFLKDAEFRVQQGGVDRIRERDVREVVAYVKGRVATGKSRATLRVKVDPKKSRTFDAGQGLALHSAKEVVLMMNKGRPSIKACGLTPMPKNKLEEIYAEEPETLKAYLSHLDTFNG